MILPDTSILIDLFRKKNKSKSKFYQLLDQYNSFAIAMITYFKLGIGSKVEEEQFWIQFLRNFEMMPFDTKASKEAIKIFDYLKSRRKRLDFADLQIASITISGNLPKSTLNRKHFEIVPGLHLLS